MEALEGPVVLRHLATGLFRLCRGVGQPQGGLVGRKLHDGDLPLGVLACELVFDLAELLPRH